MKFQSQFGTNTVHSILRMIAVAQSNAVARSIRCGALSKSISDEQGTSLVEAACVFPLFILTLVGIFSFALVFYNQLTLTQAIGTAGQYLQQNRLNQSLTDPCAAAMTAIENSAPTLSSSSISLTLNINGTQATGSTCATDLSQFQDAQGAPVTVSATYPCNLQALAGVFRYFKSTLGTTCNLSAQVTEYEY
jgi:Flp pilus assembly protein TadG